MKMIRTCNKHKTKTNKLIMMLKKIKEEEDEGINKDIEE